MDGWQKTLFQFGMFWVIISDTLFCRTAQIRLFTTLSALSAAHVAAEDDSSVSSVQAANQFMKYSAGKLLNNDLIIYPVQNNSSCMYKHAYMCDTN